MDGSISLTSTVSRHLRVLSDCLKNTLSKERLSLQILDLRSIDRPASKDICNAINAFSDRPSPT